MEEPVGLIINRYNLKRIGFKKRSTFNFMYTSTITGISIIVDLSSDVNSDESHVSIESSNDSIHIPNCKNMLQIGELITMIKKY